MLWSYLFVHNSRGGHMINYSCKFAWTKFNICHRYCFDLTNFGLTNAFVSFSTQATLINAWMSFYAFLPISHSKTFVKRRLSAFSNISIFTRPYVDLSSFLSDFTGAHCIRCVFKSLFSKPFSNVSVFINRIVSVNAALVEGREFPTMYSDVYRNLITRMIMCLLFLSCFISERQSTSCL